MLSMLAQGQYMAFVMLITALVLSLSLHEFGHAWAAKMYGDNTAERLGRLTVNPIKHIDPVGLLMVVFVGFGYAKPVPTNPANFNSVWAQFGVAIAGPAANLLIAIVAVNVFFFGASQGWQFLGDPAIQQFFMILVTINLLLMLFNLIPIGPLDGHYILPYFLPKKIALKYRELNQRYGMYFLLGLLIISALGIPVFRVLLQFGAGLIPYINFFD